MLSSCDGRDLGQEGVRLGGHAGEWPGLVLWSWGIRDERVRSMSRDNYGAGKTTSATNQAIANVMCSAGEDACVVSASRGQTARLSVSPASPAQEQRLEKMPHPA